MRNKNKKNNAYKTLQKQIFRGILSVIGLSLIIIFLFGNHGVIELYKLTKKRENIQKEIDQMRKEKVSLEEERFKLKNDDKYIEKLAREKYRMAKPNERIFKVKEKDH
tara:strand:+ start:1747 stop:2070 length:324 start_codon:yes stop_codon:yes gene_type:complete